MLIYILVGMVIQAVITFSRTIMRGVLTADDYRSIFSNWISAISFTVAFVLGAIINVTLWPLTIYYEIKNIKNGI